MTEKKYNIAVVGATGMVGRTILSILEERNFPIDKAYVLASSRSVGTRIPFKDGELVVGDLETFDFNLAEIGLFSPGASVSAIYAPKAVDAGCVVIDNTSQFRYEDDIPLVVSEVNPHAVGNYKKRGIIVFTYTMNNNAVLNYMQRFSIDGIITNFKLIKVEP